MTKIHTFILILLGILFCLTAPIESKQTESLKDKKGSKTTKKGIKTKPNKQNDDNFEQQLSCSCSCQTLQIPKKGKKAQLKVQSRQEHSVKKQQQQQIKRRKVPLRQGQSRFKSLKKSYDDHQEQQQNQKQPQVQTKTEVNQAKSDKKIKKTLKSRQQGKSKKKFNTQTTVQDKDQL